MDLKINSKDVFLFYGFNVVIFNTIFRMSIFSALHVENILPNGYLYVINFVAFIAVLMLLYLCGPQKKDFLLFLMLAVIVLSSCNLGGMLLSISCILLPIFITLMTEKVDLEEVSQRFLGFFMPFTTCIFVMGLVDYAIGGRINNFLVEYMATESWGHMIINENLQNGYRFCSIIGSPLMNATFALVYLVFSDVSYSYKKKSETIRIARYLLAMLTIVITGSRTALLLGAAYILYMTLFIKGRRKEFFLLLILVFALINGDVFLSTVGRRLANNTLEEDWRYKLIVKTFSGEFGCVRFLGGGGFGSSRVVTGVLGGTINFELPILMYLFDYGVIATVIIYLFILVMPVYRFIKMKKTGNMVRYLVIFVMLNSYNGIAEAYDLFGMMVFICLVLLYGPSELKIEENVLNVYN